MRKVVKRRSKLEITLGVLNAISEGVTKPTRIMYAVNLSWNPIQEILTNLVERELVTVTIRSTKKRSTRRYMITKKGEAIVEYYMGMKDLVGDIL